MNATEWVNETWNLKLKNSTLHMFLITECLNIYRTHVAANNFTNNNVVFFFVSDLKIVYYNNY